ncbi:hypothetical protein BVG97_16515 [Serratia marcescens]|uniref:hypothetical protein n=1 Tax=Serratia marcescens TaxID=615 RepID=UPI000B5EA7C0|nr:hypothetical protein [Serratia marcescens]ASL89106.1 hypothetical protein BVG97_16515 [Serratia marcescens]EIG9089345.1 hypothetical protein [Serratia marcescens]MBH3201196.1 hypothetical protein [Serratia marcescens]MBH3333194.1 hypothetical protein [Serratia marcescens]HEJ6927245.1 hypothetical protein [Serratia marcescens]
MIKTHPHPEIYNPEISYEKKCEIVYHLCEAMAVYFGVSSDLLRDKFIERINVDFYRLDNNPVGLLLLYEYIFNMRPQACIDYQKTLSDL